MTIINLSTPIGSKRVRSFQPPWRTVFIYRCPNEACKKIVQVCCNAFRGRHPVPGVGGIVCPHCST